MNRESHARSWEAGIFRAFAGFLRVCRVVSFGLVCCALFYGCGTPTARAQANFDRPGGDYSTFIVRSGDPAVCAARCDRESRCRSWTFSYPQTERGPAMCWLKFRVPRRVERHCCVSGVRGSGVLEPRRGPTEYATDRAGGDYRNIEVKPNSSGATCAAACQGDNKCRAWTYARPGYLGTAPRCFLKDKVRPPRRKPCCISGVIR